MKIIYTQYSASESGGEQPIESIFSPCTEAGKFYLKVVLPEITWHSVSTSLLSGLKKTQNLYKDG